MNFRKGQHVVLISSYDGANCWKNDIPEGFCYKLREDLKPFYFYVEKDVVGSTGNGWALDIKHEDSSKFEVRLATKAESRYYERINEPFRATILNEGLEEENHDSLIILLKNKINE